LEEKVYRLPLLGDEAPHFTAQTTMGKVNFPEDYKGKWVVLFSHPADFTPVCTTEFVAFQKRYDEFKKLNCELIGLSIDQVFSHIKWVEWIKEKLNVDVKFPIIADDRIGYRSRKINYNHRQVERRKRHNTFIFCQWRSHDSS